MSFPKFRSRCSYLTILIVLATNLHSASAAKVNPPITNCFIRVDNPHLSDSIKRHRGIDAVKVNAISKCNQEIFQLRFTVEIYKKGLFRDYKVAMQTLKLDGFIPKYKEIAHRGTWRKCDTDKISNYYGIAYSEALVQGKKMRTLPVMTEKIIPLPCGT